MIIRSQLNVTINVLSPEQNGVYFQTRLLTSQNSCWESYVKNSPQNQENLAEKVVVTVTTTFKSGSDTSLPDEYKVTPMLLYMISAFNSMHAVCMDS